MRLIFTLLRWLRRYGLRLALFAVCFIALVPGSIINPGDLRQAVAYMTSAYHFDYIGWEIEAIRAKADQTLFGQHPYMTEADRADFVETYLDDLARVQRMERDIERIYTDPAISDPDAASSQQQAARDALRADLAQRQLTAEAILEGQVASVLIDEGFGVLGQLLPPIAMHFTPVPDVLVISPRDEVRMLMSMNLQPMPVDQKAALETAIDARFDVASAILPLGGIALYPAMIYETAYLPSAVEIFAHEWLHHYLLFYPLGIHYFLDLTGASSAARTINETTADLFGKEIARQVIARYYPGWLPYLPPLPTETPAADATATETVAPVDPPAFDFGYEMHITRVRLDELLAAGEVVAAEAWLEARRQVFWDAGYAIRKLNQAYFAFYGGYQGGGTYGAGGTDPTGEAIRTIRRHTPSLHAFVTVMRDIATQDRLLATAARLADE